MSEPTATSGGPDAPVADTPKVNFADVAWKSYSKGRFGFEFKSLTSGTAAQNLDCTLTRVAPGQVNGPYHFHHMAEEHFIVLEGSGVARIGGKEVEIGPNDVIVCPTGPSGAHQFINTGAVPLVYLAISTVSPIDVGEYPDSDKLLVYIDGVEGTPPARAFMRTSNVDYWAGEA